MLEIGTLLDGRYKILSEIGHGGMSVVYMALNEKANKTWAVKEIRKDGKMDFNTVRQGLVAEIDTLKCLNHPNIPSVIDVIEDEESFIIVMDYIEGNSLDKALEEHGAQPQEYVIEWAKQLCDALGYLHSCNPPIIYRDMKPANIMLKPDGNITLIDFGTAKTYEIDLGETTGIGTIGYAAPEQYIGSGLGRTDARTDIYCLGITLYHLLTGIDPCKYVISNRSVRAVNPALSPGLDAIIIKCTEPQPEDRYQSCAELLYALEHHNEMGEIYRKKQKRKLISFFATSVLTIALAGTSVFGYVSAQNKKSENYSIQVENANNPDLSQKERTELFMNAIKIEPEKTEAYLEMLSLFLSSSEGDFSFSKTEAASIVQLSAGVDTKNASGFSTTLYPFQTLKKINPDGYAEVCNEIGLAYWYDYEVISERYSQAVEWFREAENKYPIAKIYCSIGQNRIEIKKYEDQKRTEKMYEAYQALWKDLKQLQERTGTLKENDIKILVWDEIVNTIYEKSTYFLVNVKKDEIETVLSQVKVESEELKKETKLEDVKVILDKLLKNITKTKERLYSAEQSEKEG